MFFTLFACLEHDQGGVAIDLKKEKECYATNPAQEGQLVKKRLQGSILIRVS